MVYLNSTDEKMLQVLLSAGYTSSFTELLSIRQVSTKAHVPYADAHKSIKKLETTGIVTTLLLGNRYAVRYNYNELVVGSYVEGLKAKLFLTKWLKIQHLIKLFEEKISFVSYSIIIFGSYAKNTQKPKSDIDIIFLTEKHYLPELEKNFIDMKQYSVNRYDAHFFTYAEFIVMLKEAPKMNIATQAYKNHIVVSGQENYMKCLQKVYNEKH